MGVKTISRIATATATAGLLAVPLLSGCSTSTAAAASSTASTVKVAASLTPRAGATNAWNSTFDKRTLGKKWAGGDVNVSLTTPTGDVWWFYGDSFTELRPGWLEWYESTALVFPRNSSKAKSPVYKNSRGKTNRTLLPANSDLKHWPSAAVVDPTKKNRYILSASDIALVGAGMWGFQMVGSTLYDITLTGGKKPSVKVNAAVKTPQPSSEGAIQWGSAMAVSGKTLYIYGSREVEGSFGKDIYLAKVSAKNYLNPKAWRFYTADGTVSTNVDNAAPLMPASLGMPHTFSVTPNPNGGGWLLVAKQNEGIGQYVVASAAKKPYGPWSEPTPLFDAAPNGDIWQYMAIAHPNVPLADGGLLVTTSQNVIADDALSQLYRDPTLYRPKFYSVPVTSLPKA